MKLEALRRTAARTTKAHRIARDLRTTALISVGGSRLFPRPGDRLGRFAFEGIPFEARVADWCAVEEVLLAREYEFVVPLLISSPAPSIVDVGANVGTFAIFALAHLPTATVSSYEPSTATFTILERNQRALGEERWRVLKYAVSDERGVARFSTYDISSSSRLAGDGDEVVDTIPLSDVVAAAAHPIDLLKVDVEGAEESVLAGRADDLTAVRRVVLELHPGRCDIDAVVDTLRHRYDRIYRVPNRASTKPLLLACDDEVELPPFLAT